MTDLEKIVEIYKSFGINCIVYTEEDIFNEQHIKLDAGGYPDGDSTVNDKITGYSGFYTLMCFDLQGKFIKQSILE